MRLANKKFPHPVLINGNKDYKKSEFSSHLKVEIEGSNFIFNVDNLLKNKGIQTLITKKEADFFLHIESNQTRYRNYLLFDGKNNASFTFPSENFAKNIEVLTGIVALKDIPKLINDDLSSDFDDLDISLIKGDILALDIEKKIRIEKENYNDNLGGIFIISPKDDIKTPSYDVQKDEDKITIFMPKRMVEKYAELQSDPDSHNILNSIFVIPVLSDVLKILKEDEDSYENCDWAFVIKDKLDKLKIPLDSIDNYYETSNKIFSTLTESSLDVLKALIENKSVNSYE